MKKAQNYRETDNESELHKKDATEYTMTALHEIVNGGMRQRGADWDKVQHYLAIALDAVEKARDIDYLKELEERSIN